MKKRIKSFLIGAVSILGTALVAVVLTPEWATLLQDAYAYLAQIGVPASVIAVLGLIVAEVWKAILNKRIASKSGYSSIASAKAGEDALDLY